MRIDWVKLAAEMARVQINCGELAQRAGISRLTVTKAKQGKPCEYDTAKKIANALNLSAAELIKEEE